MFRVFLALLILSTTVDSRSMVRKNNNHHHKKHLQENKRNARFGNYQVLCDMLCESVEDNEDDDGDCWFDYAFDGAYLCDEICDTDIQPTSRRPTTPIASTTQTPSFTTGATNTRNIGTTLVLVDTDVVQATSVSTEESTEKNTDSEILPDATTKMADISIANDLRLDLTEETTTVQELTSATPEATTLSAAMSSLRERLMPFKSELIPLWCEWRAKFTRPDSVALAEKICPAYDPSTENMPVDMQELLMNIFKTNMDAANLGK